MPEGKNLKKRISYVLFPVSSDYFAKVTNLLTLVCSSFSPCAWQRWVHHLVSKWKMRQIVSAMPKMWKELQDITLVHWIAGLQNARQQTSKDLCPEHHTKCSHVAVERPYAFAVQYRMLTRFLSQNICTYHTSCGKVFPIEFDSESKTLKSNAVHSLFLETEGLDGRESWLYKISTYLNLYDLVAWVQLKTKQNKEMGWKHLF